MEDAASRAGAHDRESLTGVIENFRKRVSAYDWNDNARAAVYAEFDDNLEWIIQLARSRGVGVIVCSIPVNLRDYPPQPTGADYLMVDRCPYPEGEAPDRSDNVLPARPAPDCDQVGEDIKTDPRNLELAYEMGCCALARQDREEALRHFQTAVDHDSPSIRATSEINRIIRQSADNNHVVLVDVERNFGEDQSQLIHGDDLFVDFVHPTVRGNSLIAFQIASILAERGHVRMVSNWRDRAQFPVDLHIERYPDQALANAYFTTASTSAVVGRFHRANRYIDKTLQYSPGHPGAMDLRLNIRLILENRDDHKLKP